MGTASLCNPMNSGSLSQSKLARGHSSTQAGTTTLPMAFPYHNARPDGKFTPSPYTVSEYAGAVWV